MDRSEKIRASIRAKYVHGSEDSTDIDVCYILDKVPSMAAAKEFCTEGGERENRNCAVITDGVVSWAYKGSPDEVNNSLFMTYSLHEQESELLIERMVLRDVPVKILRSVRIILSHLSRCSQHRKEIKAALKSKGWMERLGVLGMIKPFYVDFKEIETATGMKPEDTKKVIAFQMGQCLGLLDGVELYTKASIAFKYPELWGALYRRNTAESMAGLDFAYGMFCNRLYSLLTKEESVGQVKFLQFGEIEYDISNEKPVKTEK